MAHKTLYLLEELDDVAIHTSKLKEVVSMDDARARALYGEHQNIERIGHLVINGNTAPNLGDDPAVWNRAIYIPWGAKYIGEADGPIDPSQGIFRQDYKKKDELVSLTSAFLTVCLHDFTNYLKANKEANSFRVPQVVKDLIRTERQKINPIPVFIEKCLENVMGLSVTMEVLHSAFHGFCRARYIKNAPDYSTFLDQVGRTNLVITQAPDGVQRIDDHSLTEDGNKFYQHESNKQGFVSADNMDIPHLFKRQRQK